METSIKTGTSAIFHNHSARNQSPAQPNFKESFTARVEFVLYDDTDKERFNQYGGYEAIGTIECRMFVNNMLQSGPPIVARPLNSNHRIFPVINEMVRIVPAANYQNQDSKSNYKISYYYDDIVSTWDSPEHNAVPDNSFFDPQYANRESYQNTSTGITTSTQGKEQSVTGKRFKETGKTRKLIHLPGDHTIEGRSGNSIRMGASNGTMKAPWAGPDNNPLIIIRNGQKVTKEDAWLPIFEDINQDGSSLYMLSGQSLTFVPGNNNFDSYHQKVAANPKSNYVEPAVVASSNITELPKETIPDAAPVEYTVPNSGLTAKTNALDEDIDFLPDNENQFFTETEGGETSQVSTDPAVQSGDLLTKIALFIKDREGYTSLPFWDNKQWTWGYGTAAGYDINKKPSGSITPQKAYDDLYRESTRIYNKLKSLTGKSLSDNAWIALVSFTYNLGDSTGVKMISLINAGKSLQEVAAVMTTYHFETKNGVKVSSPGLIARRSVETTKLLQ